MNIRSAAIVAAIHLALLLSPTVSGLWWAVRGSFVLDPKVVCRRTRRLVGKQRQICKEEKSIVNEATKGAELALKECQSQFSSRRWNCTTHRKSFRRILRRDTRETAFVYAITAAGVVYSVTQACSRGNLVQCACDHSIRRRKTGGKFEWGGCADDVKYGYKKSQEFMDARARPNARALDGKRFDITTKIRLHNNEAGRRALRDFMELKCKCHGLSGSCNMKTCWTKMQQFVRSGARLKEQFDGAVQVTGSNDGSDLEPTIGGVKMFEKKNLIYSEESHDFCLRSRKYGSMGTRGRTCQPVGLEVGGCDILCCNRGHYTEQSTVRGNCKCQFIWCCEVKCQTCISLETQTHCR